MNTVTIERGRWFPQQPPQLDGESDDAYTDRLTGLGRPTFVDDEVAVLGGRDEEG